MPVIPDLNDASGHIQALSKTDLTTAIGYVQTRLTALGAPIVTTAASPVSKFALSDFQTFVNGLKSVPALKALEQQLEQQIGKLPV